MRSAMAVCDLLLMPFKPSQVDLNTLHNMSYIVKNSRRVNPKIEPYAFLSIAPTNSKIKEIELAKEAILNYPEILMLSSIIYDRKVYRDAMAEGLGVTEMLGRTDSEISSRREILDLVSEVTNGC
jgi:chromosome partitioning protein